MSLELEQEEADRLTQLLTNPQGNHTTQHRRAPLIKDWQLSKAKEMISAGIPQIKIRAECDISIHKFRKVRDGVYDSIFQELKYKRCKS